MPISTPDLDPPSSPTLDCFTGAIVEREGARAVASTYLRDSSSAKAGEPSLPSTTALTEATSVGEPPPYFARKPPLPSPVVVVRAARVRRFAARPARLAKAPIHTKSRRWQLFASLAVGAIASSVGSFVAESGSVAVAAVACLLAGVATLHVALTKRRREPSCGSVKK
jgi:hypothetical protein